jgi:hypothetical protein
MSNVADSRFKHPNHVPVGVFGVSLESREIVMWHSDGDGQALGMVGV